MRPADAGRRTGGLRPWIESELEQGRGDRAFHGLEILKSWPLFGRRAGAERGQAATALSTPADEALFWEDFEKTEASLAHLERTANYLDWPYRRLFSGGRIVVTTRDARLALGPRDVLLAYFQGERKAYVFALRSTGMRVAAVPESTEALQATVKDLLERIATGDPAWTAPAARLHQALLGPVQEALASADTLLVVPDGVLARVPFAALTPTGGAPLLERYRISSTPSFSLYVQIAGRPVANGPPRLLSVEASAPARRPANALRVFGEPRVLSGTEAAPAGVLRELQRHSVLVLDAPPSSGGGAVGAAELASITLPECHLAVLLGHTDRTGALAGAFLAAGAPSAVVQLWDVEPGTVEAVLLALFPRLMEVGPREALRQAQLAVRARPATAHPRHWGAFAHHGWGK